MNLLRSVAHNDLLLLNKLNVDNSRIGVELYSKIKNFEKFLIYYFKLLQMNVL